MKLKIETRIFGTLPDDAVADSSDTLDAVCPLNRSADERGGTRLMPINESTEFTETDPWTIDPEYVTAAWPMVIEEAMAAATFSIEEDI